MPTGTGKSGVAVLTPYVLGAKNVLVITPSRVITEQIYRDFCSDQGESFFERVGMANSEKFARYLRPHGTRIDGGLNNPSSQLSFNLVVVNAQKFGTNANVDIGEIPRNLFDLVIVDEAHHYPAPTWKNIIDHFENAQRVFLTATPFHRGGPIIG